MTDRELEVCVTRDNATIVVGRLWSRSRGGKDTASFEYTPTWPRTEGFALDPELPLGAGQFHTDRPLFNVFADASPDRWGQTLLRRAEQARARKEGRTARTLRPIDFLALVTDATRMGALRFREPGTTGFVSADSRIPPLLHLPRLLRATTAVLDDNETDDDLALLLAPGTSLGGARPKASVIDTTGRLALAKFPSREDDWPITSWEATTLALARQAEIDVPPSRLANVLGKPVLIVERFDRTGDQRIPYMSALTSLSARDGEIRSYLEIADALRASGGDVRRDLAQLWRRIAFNVLVSNTDDHLRNHGFVMAPSGWHLSPAFDLNPMPIDVRPRIHALALDEADQTASLDTVRRIAPSFHVSDAEATRIIRRVGSAVDTWRVVAAKHGLTKKQIDRMSSAFEHADLAAARRA